MSESPFYLLSMREAWVYLLDLPGLGFALVCAFTLLLLLMAVLLFLLVRFAWLLYREDWAIRKAAVDYRAGKFECPSPSSTPSSRSTSR